MSEHTQVTTFEIRKETTFSYYEVSEYEEIQILREIANYYLLIGSASTTQKTGEILRQLLKESLVLMLLSTGGKKMKKQSHG
jgi:hypothetical protein